LTNLQIELFGNVHLYKVLFLSKHTESGEILVNYQSVIFGSYYSRPLESWNGKTDQGYNRFQEID
jgi:hypothetical protein